MSPFCHCATSHPRMPIGACQECGGLYSGVLSHRIRERIWVRYPALRHQGVVNVGTASVLPVDEERV